MLDYFSERVREKKIRLKSMWNKNGIRFEGRIQMKEWINFIIVVHWKFPEIYDEKRKIQIDSEMTLKTTVSRHMNW